MDTGRATTKEAGSPLKIRWLPCILALVGLAIPMIGSGFIGWPIVVVWLAILTAIWWLRPLAGADRRTRTALGFAAIPILIVTAFEGGWYLLPAAATWLVLEFVAPVPIDR
jgi:Flp pilus assembly protein TadB